MSRRHRTRGGTDDRGVKLDALYAELPQLDCRGRCQESCGPIDMSATERARIADAGVDIPPLADRAARRGPLDIAWTCPALSALGTCSVYRLRPMICRVWGLTELLACPYGCMPEGGWLDDAAVYELLAQSFQIGGQAGTIDAPTAAQVRSLMADPRIAAYAAAVARGARS